MRRGAWCVGAFLVWAFVLFASSPAHADEVDDEGRAFREAALQALRAESAEGADACERGKAASDAEKFEDALAEYERAASLLPRSAHPRRWACYQLAALERRSEAVARCEEALSLSATPENQSALASVLLQPPQATGDLERALDLSRAAMARGSLSDLATRCEVLGAAHKDVEFRECTATLRARAPNSPSVFMLSVFAAADHDEARGYVERAKELGADPKQLAALEALLDEHTPTSAKVWRWGQRFLLVWFALGVVVATLGLALSSATKRLAAQLPRGRNDPTPPRLVQLRAVYSGVLWLACLLFYLTLPLMVLSVVAFSGGLIYVMLLVGRIPIYIVLALIVMASMTVIATLRSLFVEVDRSDPGDRLDLDQHPRLKGLLEEVAAKLETRPIDTVFITPGSQVAVFEQRSLGETLRGVDSARCLILGAAVLKGMKAIELKAVLAHEYGHFKNEDTAGGAFALAARRSLMTLIMSLASSGAATWYNPAWWLIRGFYALFLRVSHGASRLQEILADRWAAFAFGGAAFERGLTHVVRRSVEFSAVANAVLQEAVDEGHSIRNIYRKEPPSSFDPTTVEAEIEEELARPGTPLDTHPAPQERFALIRALDAPVAPTEADEAPAWDLFADRTALERELTRTLLDDLRVREGISLVDRNNDPPREARPRHRRAELDEDAD